MQISVLGYHALVRAQLLSRAAGYDGYRSLLFETANIPLHSVISTAEHLAPFNVAEAVSFLLPQMILNATVPANEEKPIAILAGALVPMDNWHYSRGFMEPNYLGGHTRYNLFSQAERKTAPLLQPALNAAHVPMLERLLRQYEFLAPCFSDHAFESYADQMAEAMGAMVAQWGLKTEHQMSCTVIPLEKLARKLLVALIERDDPVVSSILFDQRARDELRAKLYGVPCAWSETHGSFLFWGARRRRTCRLNEQAGSLVGEDVEVPLRASDLLLALRKRELWPGVFLSLITVSYLPSVPVSGGPRQAYYYKKMISALNSVFGLKRPEALSIRGYMMLTPEILPGRMSPEPLASVGTGLDLVKRGVNLDRAFAILQALSYNIPDLLQM